MLLSKHSFALFSIENGNYPTKEKKMKKPAQSLIDEPPWKENLLMGLGFTGLIIFIISIATICMISFISIWFTITDIDLKMFLLAKMLFTGIGLWFCYVPAYLMTKHRTEGKLTPREV